MAELRPLCAADADTVADLFVTAALFHGLLEDLPELKLAIAHCENIKDYGSRELFVHILESEEEHIDWLQTQLRLIEQMGIQNFVQPQTKANENGAS